MSFGGILKQSTAVDVLIGPFVDSTDGDTEETALTIANTDTKLSKNGQALASRSDTTSCVHDADGCYNCELDATDTNTLGQLTLTVHVAGALFVRHDYQVIEEAAYDAIFGASADPGPAAIADAVWDEVRSGHTTSGTFGGDAADTATLLDEMFTTDSGQTYASAVAGSVVKEMADNAGGSSLTVGDIADAVWDEDLTGHVTASTGGKVVADILVDTGTTLDGKIDTIDTNVDAVLVDTGTTLDAALAVVDGNVDAIKAKTDSLTFTVAGIVDANNTHTNDVELVGTGVEGDEWGPVP